MNLSDSFRVPDPKTGQMRRLISQITPKEEEMFRNMLRRLNHIIQIANEADVRIMIDAEQTYFQPAISRICLEMMRRYNKVSILLFLLFPHGRPRRRVEDSDISKGTQPEPSALPHLLVFTTVCYQMTVRHLSQGFLAGRFELSSFSQGFGLFLILELLGTNLLDTTLTSKLKSVSRRSS